VNLLPAGHGKTALEGDAPDMLRARQRVFRRGYYERLSVEINQRASGRRIIADAGCGVGYYIGQLAAARPEARCFGFDLSKHALKLAARAYPEVTYFVNDVKQRIALPDDSVDLLLDVFAPRNAGEFSRILKTDGALLVVIPAPNHLSELRERYQLLGIDEDKAARTVDQLQPELRLENQGTIRYSVSIPGSEIVDLIEMTPNYWHIDENALAGDVLGQTVTMSFELLTFVKG
jgi:23S rRNA (guanine745-N1)-methyltransferase